MSKVDRYNEEVEEYNNSIDEDNQGTTIRLTIYRSWWWIPIIVAIIGLVVGIKALVDYANSDNVACLKAHGQIVESGIDNGKACVDREWKLIRP